MPRVSYKEEDELRKEIEKMLDDNQPIQIIRFLEKEFGDKTFSDSGYLFKGQAIQCLQDELKRLVKDAEDNDDLTQLDSIEGKIEYLSNINSDGDEVLVYDFSDGPDEVYSVDPEFPDNYFQLLDDLIETYNHPNGIEDYLD